MADLGHELTDEMLDDLEKKIAREYAQAAKDMRKKLREYMEQFEEGKAKQKALLDAGKITKKEYKDWCFRHTMMGQQWRDMKNVLAEDLQHAREMALAISRGQMADVYALNANYATYQIEHDFGLDTSFTLYNHDTAEYLLQEQRQLMPAPSTKKAAQIAADKALQWDMKHIQSAVLQGVLQGESPYEIAKRLRSVAQMDYNASVRYARTMTTNAQNAGRYQAYRRAKGLGVDLTIEWSATLDGRTRHDHRMMHGQRRDVDQPFKLPSGQEILYPADSSGDSYALQGEIWNCRCTLLAWVKGFEGNTVKSSPKMEGMSFEEWQKANEPKKPTTAQPAAPTLPAVPAAFAIARDYASLMAQGLGRDYYDSVCDMLDSCQNEDVKKIYARFLNDIGVGSTTEGSAYHQYGRIYFRTATDGSDSLKRKKHSVFFHESGHGVDFKISKEQHSLYYSQAWQNGRFSKTIHAEVDEWVGRKEKELKAAFKEHRSDLPWLKSNGFLSDFGESMLRSYSSNYNVPFEDILSGAHTIKNTFYSGYVPSYSKSKAYAAVEREVRDVIRSANGDWKAHSLSDIVNGASKGKIKPGWGHKDSYWKTTDVSIEAFAEMLEANVSGAESLATLRQYLPKSMAAFDEMIAEYVKGI